MKRIAKTISSKEDIEFLLNLTEEEACSMSFIMENFCPFGNQPARFRPYDIFIVPPNSYGPPEKRNKNQFVTTVGRWVFNKAFIEKKLFHILGYINESMTKKNFGKINKKLSYAVNENKIALQDLVEYVTKTQKFQPYCTVLAPSSTVACFETPKMIRKKKMELFNKYKKELDANDPVTAQKIEKELLAECEENLKDDEFMDLIRSGARMSWGNNFKNMFVMRGAVKEFDPTKPGFSVMKSNFTEGISKEDYSTFANSLINGPYSRAKKTEVGGAWEKMFVRAFQHLRALPEGTDCGTKRYLKLTLTKDNIEDWIYSYVVEGGKLVELVSDNLDSYIGKTVNLRYSGFCESKDGICSKCSGHLFNRIGLTEVGIASYQICSVIKNISMKAFHDGTVKVINIEDSYGLDKIFGLI